MCWKLGGSGPSVFVKPDCIYIYIVVETVAGVSEVLTSNNRWWNGSLLVDSQDLEATAFGSAAVVC